MDPLVLMTDVEEATARLIRTAEGLSDSDLAAPSLLPGWSRGHVLTHAARNADAYTNLLTWARTGVETPAYASRAVRDADIEAGSGRPLAEQVADLRATHERFADAAAAMPVEAWAFVIPERGHSAAMLPWGRLREVEVHHADLDAGYSPADWPDAFALRLLREIVVGSPADAPPLVLRPLGAEHPLTIGSAPDAPVVSGTARELAAWLAGRADGAGLAVEPAGALPTPPRWM